MALHVDNFESFADKLRLLIKDVDVEAFQDQSVELSETTKRFRR